MKRTTGILITFFWVIFFTFLTFFSQPGCKDAGTPPEDVNIVLPSSNLTFVDHIQPLFNVKCLSSGCHNATDRAGDLNLNDYSEIVGHSIGSEPLIIKGQGATSALYLILVRENGYLGRPRMPLERLPLNENNTNGVRQWIYDDAPYSAK